MRNQIFSICILILIIGGLSTACKDDKKDLDISKIDLDLTTNYFHKYLVDTDEYTQNNWVEEIAHNQEFIERFTGNIFGETPQNSLPILTDFREYFDSLGIFKLVDEEFQSFPEEKEFEDMQKRLIALFPSYKPIPFTTMVSGFNFKNMLLDEQLGVGLELYLGDEFDYTKLSQVIHDYQMHRFNRDYIVPDAATTIIDDFYEDKGEYNTFMKRIIYEGKKLYLKSLIMPDVDPAILIGLTDLDYEWCASKEQMIWQYFVSEELLYSHELRLWNTYVFDGPFSAGMPENAPSLTGNYVGWKIVESYMEKNSEISIRELLENEDANSIFQKASYSP